MRPSGPQPSPHQWVGWYYCRPCNKVIGDRGAHMPSCKALQSWVNVSGRDANEAVKALGPKECPDCYLGFRGKDYCPTCGSRREPPLDENGRRRIFGTPSLQGQALAEAIGQDSKLEPQQWYKLKLRRLYESQYKLGDEWIIAKCLGTIGPMAMFNDYGKLGVFKEHMMNIQRFEPIDEPEGYTEPDWTPQPAVIMCEDCGHPEHKHQCAYVSVDKKQCRCKEKPQLSDVKPPTEMTADELETAYRKLVGR